MKNLGRYEILGELGRGACGVVYRAQDPRIGRQVAIKTIPTHELREGPEGEELYRRLSREAQSAGILSHPNIVTVHELDEDGPVTYIVMWVGSLALAGIPIFAGYYSKDVILESAWGAQSGVGQFAFWMGIAAALMTAFYSWRLIFLTFHGRSRADEKTLAHVHESPRSMTITRPGRRPAR